MERDAARDGFSLEDESMAVVVNGIPARADALEELERLVDLLSPAARGYWESDPDADPNGAFSVRCTVRRRKDDLQ